MNDSKMKTTGKMTVHYDEKWPFRIHVNNEDGGEEFEFDRYACSSKWKTLDDARKAADWPRTERERIIEISAQQEKRIEFIADSFNVYHETGLTPREILAQRDEILKVLKNTREIILELKNQRWSECESTDDDLTFEIDGVIAKVMGEGKKEDPTT